MEEEEVGEGARAWGWPDVLGKLARREDLSRAEASWAASEIMEGLATPAQVAAFAMGLRAKGETAEEIAGLAETMLAKARRVPLTGDLLDTCGTGGDRKGTFNISTLAAIVAAGAGARVAKHGNRAASGRTGSADLLEALGVCIDLGPEAVASCVEEVGIGFIFAPLYHPAMRHAAAPRKEMGIPTVFNFLGPLTNPAGANHQMVGVSDPRMALPMARALAALGKRRAVVVHGSDGMDEVTLAGRTHVFEVRGGSVSEGELDPRDLGFAPVPAEELMVTSTQAAVKVAQAVLAGEEGPPRDAVLLNGGVAIYTAGLARDPKEGVELARESLDSGRARAVLERWRSLSQALASSAGP
jgi:anthranilate phosphoribosyltransferase